MPSLSKEFFILSIAWLISLASLVIFQDFRESFLIVPLVILAIPAVIVVGVLAVVLWLVGIDNAETTSVFLLGFAGIAVALVCAAKLLRESFETERKAQQDRKRRAKEERETLAHRKVANAKSLRQQVVLEVERASALMVDIPNHLKSSERSVSFAINKLENRTFYPFWDAIAEAVRHLHRYKTASLRLTTMKNEYDSSLKRYISEVPPELREDVPTFPVSGAALPAIIRARETARRIDHLHDIAHSDFEFSNIYANWRTNNTLVAGFENLSLGLATIESGIAELTFSTSVGFQSLSQNMEAQTGGLADAMQNRNHEVNINLDHPSRDSTSFAQQDEMIRLLNNIQHGRRDLPRVHA